MQTVVAIALLWVVAQAPSAEAQQLEDLGRQLRPLIETHQGKVAVAVRNLKTSAQFLHEANTPMPTASLIKVSVMVEAYRQVAQGKVSLDDRITLREEDKVPGSGILTTHFSPGLQLSLRDAIRLMIAYSDNTATNLVLDKIGLAAPAAAMREMGLENTRIHAKVFRRDTSIDVERSKQFGLGSTTAWETVELLDRLYSGKLADETLTAEMLGHLKACEERLKITRYLPARTVVYHKGGSVNDTRTAAAIMETASGPVALCVLTTGNADKSWSERNAGDLVCSNIARVVFEYFQSAPAQPEDPTLALGASGRKVEILQRTLNARLGESNAIDVDGEFGPQTEEAVNRFQKQAGLPVTGKADLATWKALQPLITDEPAGPDPETVNNQSLTRAPADPIDGLPYVTAKAWAIADGETGKLLWSADAQTPRDIASVTKIMTAYVVLSLAEKEPSVLDEIITFSRMADATPGSTSGVREGEQLSVKELLYGLMLPSGNDAAVALAEHFGNRFPSDPEQRAAGGDGADSKVTGSDPIAGFVDQMNRTAKALGMTQTNYSNPHGLTAEHHLSTPADQAILARHAWKLPLFRHYVGTRQRGCKLTTAEGITRNVVWRNSNQLLGIEGYDGVKTGTTTAAGACLVSTCQRDDKRLFVVVLGATSPDARYADTRNLYRYAWNKLQNGNHDSRSTNPQ